MTKIQKVALLDSVCLASLDIAVIAGCTRTTVRRYWRRTYGRAAPTLPSASALGLTRHGLARYLTRLGLQAAQVRQVLGMTPSRYLKAMGQY